jgi:CO dehydrogenase maturation factor
VFKEVSIGKVIAVNGKGGTGKTAVSALLVAHLVAKKAGSILAIDADPNSCFAEALGVSKPDTIVGECDELSKHMDKIPSGMTKERYITLKVQEAVTECDGFDLLVMGRPEGPGCYCYINNLLRGVIDKLTGSYDYVVIDNAAGMEHISRRTETSITKLVVVSDYSIPAIRSAGRIYDLARELKIKIGGASLIINKASGPISELKGEVDKTGLELAGVIDYDEKLVDWNISNKPIFEFKGKKTIDAAGKIFSGLEM